MSPKPQPQGDPRTLNAYRHGLTGQVRFCTPADEQAYKKHCAGYMEDFAPKAPSKPTSPSPSPTAAGA